MEGKDEIERVVRGILESGGVAFEAFLGEKEALMERKAELDARIEAASMPIPPRAIEIR